MMPDCLIIVESPTKAKTIGKFLGARYKVIASTGHVLDLPKSKLGVDVDDHFKPTYITIKGKGEVLAEIRKEASKAKKVLLATDPDREGEAIAWHIADVIKLDPAAPCRVEFHEITKDAVRNAIKVPRPIDTDLFNAQQTRRILDRLVGYGISPILWRYGYKGASAGRVQSVAMRILCDREREIRDFVPKEYWIVTARLKDRKGRKTFDARYFGEGKTARELHTASEAAEVVSRSDGPFMVTAVNQSEERRSPKPPFTTSTLQQEASRKYNFNTGRTMMVAQQLYEGIQIGKKGTTGLITYMRTDSVRISGEAQAAALSHIRERLGERYVPDVPNVYRGRSNAQDAHEAIRPTDIANTPEEIRSALTPDQFKIYKLIYDRFLSSQMAPARILLNTSIFECGGSSFRSSGQSVLFDGFTAVYTEGHDETQEKASSLPQMAVGDVFLSEGVMPEQKFTQPKPRYTEASLIKLLEEKGIGRPSTYAPTISTIMHREYVAKDGRQLVPTGLGFVINDFMTNNFSDIVDIPYTARMEAELDDIASGTKNWEESLASFYTPIRPKVTQPADGGEVPGIIPPESISPVPIDGEFCPNCGAQLIKRTGKKGVFAACPNYPDCRFTKTIIDRIGVKCPKCGSDIIRLKSRKKQSFYKCENQDCDFICWDVPTGALCPHCGKPIVKRYGREVCTTHGCEFNRRRSDVSRRTENDGNA